MQIQQTSSVSANNDLAPTVNSPSRQKNWNKTIANITGLTTGLAVFTIIANDVIKSAIQHGVTCELLSQTGVAEDGCIDKMLNTCTYATLAITALSLTVGICAGKVTQLALRALQTSPQIENKISTEQKA